MANCILLVTRDVKYKKIHCRVVFFYITNKPVLSREILHYYSGFISESFTYLDTEIDLKIWYPTHIKPLIYQTGYFSMKVSLNATISPNAKHGLVIISHGSGGSNLNHRNLALYLSKRGYIVASILHPNDNYKSHSASRREENWINRPKHLQSALNYLLNGKFRSYINKKKISLIGHSIGGFTSIAIIGGKYNLANINKHCQRNGAFDANFCGHTIFNATFRRFFPDLFIFKNEIISEINILFSKAIIFSPAAVPFHGKKMLEDIDIPVLILSAEFDEELTNQYHADYLAKNIKNAKHEKIEGAGHFSFITPFPEELRHSVGKASDDPEGFDRSVFHHYLEERVLKYLETGS